MRSGSSTSLLKLISTRMFISSMSCRDMKPDGLSFAMYGTMESGWGGSLKCQMFGDSIRLITLLTAILLLCLLGNNTQAMTLLWSYDSQYDATGSVYGSVHILVIHFCVVLVLPT